jgi:mono/diheme cytochrome c family protein
VISGLPAILIAIWAASTVAAASGQTAAAPSVLAGAFTEEQAIRGQTLYYEHCLACHGEDMTGLEQTPPLAGPQFTGIWDGEPLWALVGRIDAMPPTEPGSLSRAETVDLLAYMLWYNGLPSGEMSLSTQQSVLGDMAFRTPPLPGQ